MTHLLWYYIGCTRPETAIPILVIRDGEWVKTQQVVSQRKAKTMCSKYVLASEITSRKDECECPDCKRCRP